MPEVGRVDGDLGGDDDLILGADRLGVVALHPAARGLDVARIEIAEIDLAFGRRRRRKRLRRTAELLAVLVDAARAIGLIGGVGPALDAVFLLESALGLPEPVGPIARDRPRLRGTLVVKATLGVAQPAAPALGRRELRRQLVTARIAELRVFFSVDGVSLGEDLARDLLVITRGLRRRIGRELGAIDGDHADANQTRVGAQLKNLAEQPGQRRLVTLTKPRDRRVIRRLICTDHTDGNVFDAAALQAPRRALPDRVAIEQQRHHHRRIVRRPTMPVDTIGGVEPAQVHRRHSVDDEPRQMPLRQPLPQARRQQQLLITTTRDEVLRHPEMVLTAPDGPAPLCNSLHGMS